MMNQRDPMRFPHLRRELLSPSVKFFAGINELVDVHKTTREVEYQQAVYTLLLKQYEAARLDESNEAYVVQVVERPDRLAVPQQAFANMVADEPRATGDQKVHGRMMGSNVQCSRSKVNP